MSQNMNFDKHISEKIRKRKEKISHMTRDQLIEQLNLRNLNTAGVKKVLEKRLRLHDERVLKKMTEDDDSPCESPGNTKMQSSNHAKKDHSVTRFYIVIDYEATCCKEDRTSFNHEIIEFPAVLVDAHRMAITKEFHSYVRPVINPILTEYCTNLTGIQQKTVDSAPEFPEVLERFEEWMSTNELGKKNCIIVTDGYWDMGKFLYLQCKWNRLRLPRWSRHWLDIRRAFSVFYKRRNMSLASMLHHLSLKFTGRQHSGIDDSRNIARILMQLMQDGCEKLDSNQEMYSHKIRTTNRINRRAQEEEEEKEVEGNGVVGGRLKDKMVGGSWKGEVAGGSWEDEMGIIDFDSLDLIDGCYGAEMEMFDGIADRFDEMAFY